MNEQLIFSKEWINFKKAERELFAAQYYFKKSPSFLEQLVLALQTLSEQGSALRFIKGEIFDSNELQIIIPLIVDIAVDGNVDNLPLAREILVSFRKNSFIKVTLSTMFDTYLQSKDDFIYRRLAELLFELNYSDLRIRLMNECKNNDNEDIAEIYDDFNEKYE